MNKFDIQEHAEEMEQTEPITDDPTTRKDIIPIEKKCFLCGQYTVKFFEKDLIEKLKTREKPIQTICPDLSKEDREFLITGMCDKCQKEMF